MKRNQNSAHTDFTFLLSHPSQVVAGGFRTVACVKLGRSSWFGWESDGGMCMKYFQSK
jgi:hypothetical protein